MHPIKSYPNGHVVGSVRVNKGDTTIDLVRIKNGARTCFVESFWRLDEVVTFRKTDEFPSDGIADRFYQNWITQKTENEEYTIINKKGN